MDFLTGLTNFTNWSGNVIMPTLAGIFFVIAILRAARSAPYQYAMYAGLMSLMVSGILRGIEAFPQVVERQPAAPLRQRQVHRPPHRAPLLTTPRVGFPLFTRAQMIDEMLQLGETCAAAPRRERVFQRPG